MFAHFYKEYIIFLKTRDDSLVQVSGTNIFVYLNDKLGRLQSAFYEGKEGLKADKKEKETATESPVDENGKPKKQLNIPSHKYNIKNVKDDFHNNLTKNFWDEIVNRNRLFYCAHMNRKNAFFQKHFLNSNEPVEKVVDKILTEMLGFNRIRKSVTSKVREMLKTVIERQKKFDYNYYLTKNCPLPQNWKEKKAALLQQAETDQRGQVYKYLFEQESSYRHVSNYITEFIA